MFAIDTVITVKDLFIILLSLVGIGVGVFLIMVFKNLADVLKNVKILIKENQGNVEKALNQLPEIMGSVNSITGDVEYALDDVSKSVPIIVKDVEGITTTARVTVEKAGETISTVEQGVKGTVETVKANSASMTNYIKLVSEILKVILGRVSKSKT